MSIFLAATHSLPEPAKGTTNVVSFSLFKLAFINFSHNSNGFCVGWSTRSFFPAPPASADIFITSRGNAPFSCAVYVVSFSPLLKRPFVAFLTLPAAFFKYVSVYGSLTSSLLNTGFSL